MGQDITIQCKLGWFDMNLGIDKTIYQTHRVGYFGNFFSRKENKESNEIFENISIFLKLNPQI
jgi:hypothetical protein